MQQYFFSKILHVSTPKGHNQVRKFKKKEGI